jgi:heme/copper-type cytochrome/quinol oxidase subunit 2
MTEDPGWAPAVRLAALTFVPLAGPFMNRKRRSVAPGLLQLRAIVIDLLIALPLFIIAFSFIAPWDAGDDGASPYLVLAIGATSVAWAWRISIRRLQGSSERALAIKYRSRMFVGIGVAEGAALWAIAITFFVSPSVWLIALGSMFAFVAFWFVARTRRNLERDQQRLRREGSSLDLITALNTLPPTSWQRARSQ